MKKWLGQLAGVVIYFAAMCGAEAVVRYVNVNGAAPVAPYTNWTNAATRIQDAVDAANPGDEVLVTNGIYAAGGRVVYGTVTNRVAVTKSLVLRSVNGPAVTSIVGYQLPGGINGPGAVRCVYLTNGALLLGFTITNGATRAIVEEPPDEDLRAGGVWCEAVSAIVSNCVVTGNAAGRRGGGVGGGSAIRSVIRGNVSGETGGGADGSTLRLCSLVANQSSGSIAGGGGGGANGCAVSECVFSVNQSVAGGGTSGSLVTNSLFYNNTADYGGGSSFCTLNNCTLTGNSSPNGGGVFGGTANNCIVYYNGSQNYAGGALATITWNYSCTTPFPGGIGNFTNAPLFVDPVATNYQLQAGSPCVNSGDNQYATNATDLNGNVRIVGGTVDVGAYEFHPTGPLHPVIQSEFTNIAVGMVVNFAGAVSPVEQAVTSAWKFSDGTTASNQLRVTHAWVTPGSYPVIFTAYNNSNPGGVSATTMVQVVSQAVFYVNAAGTNPVPPFLSWNSAALTIQDAIDAASVPGSLVLVTNGVYQTGGRVVYGALTNRVVVAKPVLVRSVNGPGVTLIRGASTNGDAAVRCVYLGDRAALDGFTLTGGATRAAGDLLQEQSGGGIWCPSTNVVITNCVFAGNASAGGNGGMSGGGGGGYGGAYFNCVITNNFTGGSGGGVMNGLLFGCSVVGNSATGFGAAGGGVFTGTLSNCVVTGNAGFYGGGANSCDVADSWFSGNSAIVTGGAFSACAANRCILTNNSAWSSGGADQSTLNQCILTANFAAIQGGGAGFYCTLNNCLLAGNVVNEKGGGAFLSGLNNCTLVNNSAGLFGGGVDSCSLNNSILYFNTAPTNANYSADSLEYCCTTPLPTNGTGNFENPPEFVNAPAGNFRLQPASFGINVGNNAYVTSGRDLDGNPRIAHGTVDIGAYEFQQLLPVAFTAPVTEVRSNQAALNGFAVPNGQASSAWFEWGPRGTFNQFTAPVSVGSGSNVIRLQSTISNLAGGTVYQGRLAVSNVAGVAYGAPQLFTSSARLRAWGYTNAGQTVVPGLLHSNSVMAVAGGGYFTLALMANGRVLAWGDNSVGQTNVPATLSNVVAVAAGEAYSLALRSNGTVVGWGDATNGAANVPTGLSNIVMLAGGGNHALALRSNGTVVAWGRGSDGQTNVPAGLSNVVAIAAGRYHSVALKADGTLVNWGRNVEGQTNMPVALNHIVAVAGGGYHTLALRGDGTTRGWGFNQFNQTNAPVDLTNAVAVAGGMFHNLALRADGTVAAWWYNNYGESTVPSGLSNTVLVAAGFDHSLVTVGDLPPQAAPTNAVGVAGQDLLLKLSGSDVDGDALTLRITGLPATGSLYQYNNGVRGALITAINNVVTDSAGRVFFVGSFSGPQDFFAYVANDGLVDSTPAVVGLDLYIPGLPFANTQPAVGIVSNAATLRGMATPNGLAATAWFEWGQRGTYAASTIPVAVGNGFGVVPLSVTVSNLVRGVDYQCRLVVSNSAGVRRGAVQMFATAKRVHIWGENLFGQTNLPAGLGDVVALSSGGGWHVLRPDGTLVVWGRNNSGQTNTPPGLTNVIAVAAGGDYNLALRSDGTVAAWSGTPTNITLPSGLTNIVMVSAGGHHNLALKADGTLMAWGLNDYGQTNIPAGLSNVVGMACGLKHNIVLKDDGTVLAWGLNEYGTTSVPAGLSNVVDVAANYSASMVRKADGTVVVFSNLSPLTNVPPALTNTAAVACGGFHGLAMKEDGALATWGYLGTSLILPADLTNAVAVSAGGDNSLALVDNIPPVAIAQTATGPANQDLVISLAGLDADKDIFSFRVVSLPAVGALYQYNAGSRGALIAATNTLVTDPLGRVIFAPAPAGFGEPYATFAFVAHDGLDDSLPASVNVNIVGRPYAHALAPTELTRERVVLNGATVPNGFAATAWFEWGPGGNFTNRTIEFPAGSGSAVVPLSVAISNFVWGADYQFRLVVSNEVAVTFGFPQALLTGKRLRAWGDNGFGQTNMPRNLTNIAAVAAGTHHNLVIETGGAVVAWGWNNFGQTNVPAGVSNAVSAAAALGQNIVVRADGTVLAWAGSGFNDTNVPPGLSNVVQVSAGERSGLALRADGSVVAWGSYWNNFNYVPMFVPAGLSNVVALSAGNFFSVALKADGTLTSWGWGPNGETNVPVSLGQVVAVAAGGYHGLALKADGTVATWGGNSYGESTVPAGLSNVVSIAARDFQSFALKADGTVVSWGQNDYGQLTVPAGLNYIAAIFAGEGHTLALTSNSPPVVQPQSLTGNGNTDLVIQLSASDADGDALAFVLKTLPAAGVLYQYVGGTRGAAVTTNDTPVTDGGGRIIFAPAPGALGSPYASFLFTASDGDAASAAVPVVINEFGPFRLFTRPATDVRAAAAGLNGFVAPNGFATTAWFEWGTNLNYGQVSAPFDVGASFGVVHLSLPITGLMAGQVIHFRLVASNVSQTLTGMDQQFITGGKVRAWGDNSSGQSSTPTNQGLVVAVAGGLSHSLALRVDGTVKGWGNNAYGQGSAPTSLSNVVAVAAGGFHNVALLANGAAIAWGRNNFGQTNVPAGATNGVAVAAGGQHGVLLRADGSVVAWGDNSQGQRTVPASLTNAVAIAAGWYHNVALRGDGTVTAWGANTYGQVNVPAGLTNVVWVGAGLYHSLALRSDGSLIAWGLNSSGQTNIPAAMTNMLSIACGGSHNLGLRADNTFSGWGNNASGQALPPASVSNVVNFAGGGTHSLALVPDRAPSALDQLAAGFVNADLLIALTGSDPDNDSLAYRITSLPAAGTLYQFDGVGRGSQIGLAGTAVTDNGGRVVLAPAPDQLGSPYTTFNFVAGDGLMESGPALVTVNLGLPAAPSLVAASSGVTANGAFQLAFTGSTNAGYRVWASTNLLDWEALGLASSVAPGFYLYMDSAATNWPQRFYRATSP